MHVSFLVERGEYVMGGIPLSKNGKVELITLIEDFDYDCSILYYLKKTVCNKSNSK